MAKRATTIVVLEIEPSGVHAAAVTVNGRVSVKTAAVAPLETGIVRDGEVNDVEALAEALRSLYRENKGLDKKVRVGIANQKIVVRVLELPPLEDRNELEAAVRFQAQDQIPMPLDSAVLDFQPLDIVETDAGRRQRVLIVAARRDMVDRVLMACKTAGLKPEGIDLSAFAMIRRCTAPRPARRPSRSSTSRSAGSRPSRWRTARPASSPASSAAAWRPSPSSSPSARRSPSSTRVAGSTTSGSCCRSATSSPRTRTRSPRRR